MPSLLRQLFDTMPLSGVRGAIKRGNGPKQIEDAKASSVADHISYRDANDALALKITCPAPKDSVRKGPAEFVELWSWQQDALNVFGDITCRPRDDGFKQYRVLEQVAWGLPEGEGLEPAIEIELAGISTKLPLTEPFHLMSFLVEGGYNAPNLDPLFPLEARHDPSVVHAFVYDVIMTPRRMMALADPSHPEAEEVEAMRSLCRQVFPLSNENVELRTMREEVFIDHLWPEPLNLDNPAVALSQIVTLEPRPARILVAVCLTTCREDWRFTPGSEAGMARLYPQLFIKSNATLGKIRATMNVDRPTHTTILDPPRGKCGCPEMKSPIGSLLVADSNKGMENMYGNAILYNDAQPYWSNLFAYLQPDAFAQTKGAVLNVVRNDRQAPRKAWGLIRRYPVRSYAGYPGGLLQDLITGSRELLESPDKPSTLVERVARQGPFDNVHLAPRMAMGLGSRPRWATPIMRLDAFDDWDHYPIDPSTWKTEEVVMAPICAHDCFHMHWRWSDTATTHWTCGWSDKGPYSVPGAVMIPLNQEIDLQMRSEHSFAYHARAFDVPPNSNTVFCHHGAAYALTVGEPLGITNLPFTEKTPVATARGGIEANTIPLTAFADDEGKFLRAASSWAVFYWQLRWDIVMEGGRPTPRERVQINDPYLKDLLAL